MFIKYIKKLMLIWCICLVTIASCPGFPRSNIFAQSSGGGGTDNPTWVYQLLSGNKGTDWLLPSARATVPGQILIDVAGDGNVTWQSGGGGGGAPTDATYITQIPNVFLTNEQPLSLLATGLMKNTTSTGVVSIAIPGVDYLTSPVLISQGGTGQITQQDAINALTDVSAATDEFVLTKDTTTGNAIYKEVPNAIDATYLLQTPDGTLPNAQPLSLLATGLMKNTTSTGVVSIAIPGTDYLTAPVLISQGGTGQITQQDAINVLTDVSAATDEFVLTKDTTTGDAIYKDNKHYSDAQAQDAVGAILDTSGSSGDVIFSYTPQTLISANVQASEIDHNSLANLAVADVHTQYAYGAGRSGGQVLVGGITASEGLILQSTSGTGTSDSIRMKVGNNGATEAMTILNNGNVGIGTANPLARSHVQALSEDPLLLTGDNGATGQGLAFRYSTAYSNNWGAFRIHYPGAGNSELSFWTKPVGSGTTDNVSERMRIDTSGFVGIGTTGPDRRLEILDASNPQLRLSHTGRIKFLDVEVNTNHDAFFTSSSNGGFRFTPTIDSTTFFQIFSEAGGTPIIDVDSVNKRFGIGTASPTSKLTIEQSADILGNGIEINDSGTEFSWNLYSNTNALVFDSNTNPRFVIERGGNVGIGTTNPGVKLDVVQPVDISAGVFNLTKNNGGSSDAFLINDDRGFGGAKTGTTLRVRSWNSGGDDTGALANFESWTGAGTSRFYVGNSGGVGIGTTSPNYQLELSTNSAGKPISGTWTIVSDRRTKEKIQPFRDGLSTLRQLNPVSYELNGKAGTPKGDAGIGIIAQEVLDILPYAIDTYHKKLNQEDPEETELYNFDPGALTFVLINAVKEQDRMLQQQQEQINTLVQQIKLLTQKE